MTNDRRKASPSALSILRHAQEDEERGPILQTEKFAFFKAAHSWKLHFSFNVNVPLSSGEGLGVRLSDGFVNAHRWILYVGLRRTYSSFDSSFFVTQEDAFILRLLILRRSGGRIHNSTFIIHNSNIGLIFAGCFRSKKTFIDRLERKIDNVCFVE